MADTDYARLACGGCGGFFEPTRDRRLFCSRDCNFKAKAKKPVVCAGCGRSYLPKESNRRTYCSRECAFAAKAAAPKSSAWFAGFCQCGAAHGARRSWQRCPECERQRQLAAGREASLTIAVARHRAAGRVVCCDECGAAYCPLYGAKPSATPLCTVCRDLRQRRQKRAQGTNHVQRAKRAGVPYRYFNERKVLERDEWTCQLCGIPTPEGLRGTCEPNAPEFDHCIPFALGGPHWMENSQCLCRACNGKKHDGWCERSARRAASLGLDLASLNVRA